MNFCFSGSNVLCELITNSSSLSASSMAFRGLNSTLGMGFGGFGVIGNIGGPGSKVEVWLTGSLGDIGIFFSDAMMLGFCSILTTIGFVM